MPTKITTNPFSMIKSYGIQPPSFKSHPIKYAKGCLAGLLMAFLFLLLPAGPLKAQVEIDITQGNIRDIPIAVAAFEAKTLDDQRFAQEVVQVIQADLAGSGLFIPLDPESFIDKAASVARVPKFSDWRIIKAQALLVGQVERMPDRRIKAQFRLWDVFSGKQLSGEQFFIDEANWRRVGHVIADTVYQRLTGEAGYFDTRVAFIDETGPKKRRVKRLAIMDQDGHNLRYLTQGQHLVLTPRFSPKAQEITYMSYESGAPRVYLLNLDTMQKQVVGDFPNMTFAPRFSPDGKVIIMSLQEGGNANIYTMDLQSRQISRLTNSPSIDTAPSFSPDGSQVVFESDRGGSKQLYVMNRDGSNVRRISQQEGRYSTPVWSPRGDLIAFTKQVPGRFLIGVMRPDGSGERIITEGYHNEGPTWAPNGRVLMFFRESPGGSSGPKIYSVDLTGYNEKRIRTPSWGSDPAWSPRVNK
ncbi:MAG: protein TolB [Rhodomicrobium sp.]|nr:MAG: protein TolB [Rhodomicrobium sp.]